MVSGPNRDILCELSLSLSLSQAPWGKFLLLFKQDYFHQIPDPNQGWQSMANTGDQERSLHPREGLLQVNDACGTSETCLSWAAGQLSLPAVPVW